MKISVLEIREIVRAALHEAPLEDVLPFADRRTNQTFPTSEKEVLDAKKRKFVWVNKKDLEDQNSKQVEKFFSNKKFNDDAVKTYKNLSIPIYIIPSYARGVDDGGRNRAYGHVDITELSKLGLSPQKIEELRYELDSGATVWIIKASSLRADFLPTPWMVVHSMFDGGGGDLDMFTEKVFERTEIIADYVYDSKMNVRDVFKQCLTMKSARNGRIVTSSDAAAEILCQAILTTAGFVYNKTGAPQVDSQLEQIEKLVKHARGDFESLMHGKIFDIDVYQDDTMI